jgi:hypothetical protein
METTFLSFDREHFHKGNRSAECRAKLVFRFGVSELVISGSVQTIEALAEELQDEGVGSVSLTIRRPTDAS